MRTRGHWPSIVPPISDTQQGPSAGSEIQKSQAIGVKVKITIMTVDSEGTEDFRSKGWYVARSRRVSWQGGPRRCRPYVRYA